MGLLDQQDLEDSQGHQAQLGLLDRKVPLEVQVLLAALVRGVSPVTLVILDPQVPQENVDLKVQLVLRVTKVTEVQQENKEVRVKVDSQVNKERLDVMERPDQLDHLVQLVPLAQ